jgi:hypothetical protein
MLGGNSLSIPKVVMKINLDLDTNITIREFILNSTIKTLADYIKNNTLYSNDTIHN